MPHVIVEYSANIEADLSPDRLVDEIHQAAITSGIAEPVAVRTRLKRREHYRVGDGSPENAFVHIDVRGRKGRTPEQKAGVVRGITDAVVRELGVPPQSVEVLLIEVGREHWAFGGNLASQQAPVSSSAP